MITELDIQRADADELAAKFPDYLDPQAWTERQEEYEYWQEVQSCCGGTDWTCQHYRYYSALDDRFTHYED